MLKLIYCTRIYRISYTAVELEQAVRLQQGSIQFLVSQKNFKGRPLRVKLQGQLLPIITVWHLLYKRVLKKLQHAWELQPVDCWNFILWNCSLGMINKCYIFTLLYCRVLAAFKVGQLRVLSSILEFGKSTARPLATNCRMKDSFSLSAQEVLGVVEIIQEYTFWLF